MPRHTRPHPVHTFRFWFLVLAVACATAAWKLELLPLGKARPAADAQSGSADLGASADSTAPDESSVFLGQSEPQPSGNRHGAAPRVMPRADTVAQSPFGAATPEFVAAPTSIATEADDVAPDQPAESVSPAVAVSAAEPQAAENFIRQAVVQAAGESVPEASDSPFAAATEPAAPAEEFDFTEIDANLSAGTKEGDVAAHRALSKLYWDNPALRPQFAQRIEQTARRIYFQPQPHYLGEYEVQAGENLQGIAKKYTVSWQYLDRLNRISGRPIQVGQKLKVIKGPFGAVVDLSDYEITIHCHGHYVYKFPVGVGKDGATPIGTFTVEDKMANPPYDGPEGSFAADNPQNPVGERWISLGGGYGIHGTLEPDSIGKSESLGCIRLHNADVEIVYDLLTVGSEVVIQR